METQSPAVGIMQSGEWKDAKSFIVGCDCHAPEHQVHTWIEVDRDSECRDITVTFFVNTTTPFWRDGFNRVKAAWNVLWRGYDEQEHCLILREQAALNFAGAITESVKELGKAESAFKNQ